MTATVCAFCDARSNMAPQWAEYLRKTVYFQGSPTTVYILQGVGKCDNCGRASLGYKSFHESTSNPQAAFRALSDLTWHPVVGRSPEFSDVPEHIAQAAKEAHEASSINARMSAILMARTVVEATAKAKGITSGMLVKKIEAMADAGLVRASTKDAAHEIRHFGNDMAHGDIEDQPTDEDVEEVLALMNEVLNEVFQGPARTARIRAKREATTA